MNCVYVFFFHTDECGNVSCRVRWIDPVVVVVSPDRVDFTRQLLKEHGGLGPHRRRTLIAVGGSSRHRSIHNGIKFLTAQCELLSVDRGESET